LLWLAAAYLAYAIAHTAVELLAHCKSKLSHWCELLARFVVAGAIFFIAALHIMEYWLETLHLAT
jgi:hypothetical protein